MRERERVYGSKRERENRFERVREKESDDRCHQIAKYLANRNLHSFGISKLKLTHKWMKNEISSEKFL